jgi:hypothetical protein
MKLPPIPESVLTMPVEIVIKTGQDPYGNATGLTISGNCRLVEKSTRILDAEKRLIQLSGHLYMAGDIAPSLSVIEGGTVTIGGRTWQIYSAERPHQAQD